MHIEVHSIHAVLRALGAENDDCTSKSLVSVTGFNAGQGTVLRVRETVDEVMELIRSAEWIVGG